MAFMDKIVSALIVRLVAVLAEQCLAAAEAIQRASEVAGIRHPPTIIRKQGLFNIWLVKIII
jgi:hypothetical protein